MPYTTIISDKVEFRWRQHEAEWKRRLAEEAEKAERTIGDHARELLKNLLVEKEEMLHQLESIKHQLAMMQKKLEPIAILNEGCQTINENIYLLRDDWANFAIQLLMHAGSMTPEAAAQWVTNYFEKQA
jgi:hypothetical protein